MGLSKCQPLGILISEMKRVKSSDGRARLIGIGFDNQDKHIRITQGDKFSVYFGSESTHERMQEFCIKFTEKLDRKGKDLGKLSRREFRDIASDIL